MSVQQPPVLSLNTSVCEDPSLLWYDNPPSFVEEVRSDGSYLDHAAIMKLRNTSTSRKNFAALIVSIFTTEERTSFNVNGKKKNKLDPHRISFVKQKVFQMYPLQAKESQDKAWAECVVVIDEANRRLNR